MAHAISGSGSNDLGLGVLVTAVKREYEDMPGLTVTLEQARRLWALEPRTCSVVLTRLVESGYLCRTDAGRYARTSAA